VCPNDRSEESVAIDCVAVDAGAPAVCASLADDAAAVTDAQSTSPLDASIDQ
jgi:hypothetical protein